MRGRLGSMGSISSFERVSVLEGEHENSQHFTQGSPGILTFTQRLLEACYIAALSSEKDKYDKHALTFVSYWRPLTVLVFSQGCCAALLPHSFLMR